MTEEASSPSEVYIHDDFIRHVEVGASKMKLLSWITIVVAFLLALSYIAQLALPLAGTTSVTVSLNDPAFVVTEVLVLILTVAWLYVGVRNLRFTTNLASQISAARRAEADIERRIKS